jgi:hypothetical protein
MSISLIALSLLQAAVPAAAAAPAPPPRGWTVANSAEGCLVHTSERVGIVLSVFALPDQEGIGFLLQNRKWEALEDGKVYPLSLRFDDGSAWPVPALARTRIDEDGPGLFFVIPSAGENGGRDFLSDFADARGMRIANSGVAVGSLALSDSRGAAFALARCLRTMIDGEANPFSESEGASSATRI